MPREHDRGTIVLVFGIIGLLCCGPLSIAAWIMGHQARKDMAAQPTVIWTNRSNVTAGWVLGIIGTVLWVGVLLFYVAVIGAFATS